MKGDIRREPTPAPWTLETMEGGAWGERRYITGHITSPLHTYAGNKQARKDSIAHPDSMTFADGLLIAKAPEMKAMLKKLEFCGQQSKCPVCVGWDATADKRGETPLVHTDDCELAALLAATEDREP